MKRLFNISALLALFILITSCDEEWLEPEPLSFFTPQNVYEDKAGFESLLITMRKDLKKEHTGYMHYLTMEYASSDLGSPWSQLDFYNLTPNTDRYYNFLNMFITIYESVKNTNVLISRIDNIEWDSEEERNLFLGEAYWHRAYWYYRLVNSYGDVPFIGDELAGAKLDFYSHSRWTILDKIQEDLEFAAQWLPDNAEPNAVSKAACNHLLAKVYLANMEYDKAYEAATQVIEGPYALMNERFGSWAEDPQRNVIWDLHRPENMNLAANTETILGTIDRYEAPAGARSDGLYTMRIYNAQWMQAAVLDSEGKSGMLAEGPMYDSLGRGNANVRLTGFYQYDIWNDGQNTWQNTPDLRRSDINWVDISELRFNNPASVDYGEPVSIDYLAAPIDTFKYLYAMPHYIMYVPQQEPNARPMGGNGDWYLFRLAETYLLRAEASYWKGDLSSAANDINVVRERSGAIPITGGDVTIDFIFDERGRELFAEAPRHSELVRVSYMLASSGLGGYSLSNFSEKNYYFDRVMRHNKTYEGKITLLGNTANMAPFHVLWPIPQSVITANTLGTINQNIGYVGAENNVPPLETIEDQGVQ